jgi:tetratricopeptide (TPR) repeat protein
MKLSGVEYQKLVESIVQAYPTKNDLAQIVMYSLEENIDAIVNSETTTQSIVFNLINWAETRGKLKNLLEIISQERPDNLELQNTIKNLLEKYSQDNKINSEHHQDNQKKNKFFSFIKLFLGILIIPIGIMSYQISQQPRLSCNDTELQKQDDSIKIIISNFNGTNSQKLENRLYQKFYDQLRSKASKIIVCLTTNTKQKIKNNLEARELGKQLLPKNDKQRDLALIIWLDESTLTGGIEFINDDMEDIPLSYDLDPENNTRNILNEEFYKKVYLFTSLGLSKVFYYKLNNSSQSQYILQNALDTLDQTLDINCNGEKLNKIAKNNEIANVYFNLGLFYEDEKSLNIKLALQYYECGLKIYNNANIHFQLASIYNKEGDKLKAKRIYTELTKSGNVSNDIKSLSFAEIGILFAKENKCSQAEQEFSKSINLDSNNGRELRAYTRLFDCQNFEGAIEDLEKLCPEPQIDKDECKEILRSYYRQLLQLEKSRQLHIVENIKKLRQSQPQRKQIINQIVGNL